MVQEVRGQESRMQILGMSEDISWFIEPSVVDWQIQGSSREHDQKVGGEGLDISDPGVFPFLIERLEALLSRMPLIVILSTGQVERGMIHANDEVA